MIYSGSQTPLRAVPQCSPLVRLLARFCSRPVVEWEGGRGDLTALSLCQMGTRNSFYSLVTGKLKSGPFSMWTTLLTLARIPWFKLLLHYTSAAIIHFSSSGSKFFLVLALSFHSSLPPLSPLLAPLLSFLGCISLDGKWVPQRGLPSPLSCSRHPTLSVQSLILSSENWSHFTSTL